MSYSDSLNANTGCTYRQNLYNNIYNNIKPSDIYQNEGQVIKMLGTEWVIVDFRVPKDDDIILWPLGCSVPTSFKSWYPSYTYKIGMGPRFIVRNRTEKSVDGWWS